MGVDQLEQSFTRYRLPFCPFVEQKRDFARLSHSELPLYDGISIRQRPLDDPKVNEVIHATGRLRSASRREVAFAD
jgi:hypothetical protein